jgi:hypothetical protein
MQLGGNAQDGFYFVNQFGVPLGKDGKPMTDFNNRVGVSLSVQSIFISAAFTHDSFLYSSATIATDAAAVTAPPTTSDR